jgi:hypothetical protein
MVYGRLLAAIKVYNKYSPEPISLLEEAFEKTELRSNPLETCYWSEPGEDVSRSTLKMGKSGITLRSINDEASITLSRNGLLAKVTYHFKLPQKKPEWTYVENQEMSFGERRMVMRHMHATQSQYFSISALPTEWHVALHLLW